MKRNVCVYQIDSLIKNKNENLLKVQKVLEESSQQDFIVIPEFFTTGYHLDEIGDDYYELAEEIPGATTNYLSKLAKQHETVIIANIVEKDAQLASVLYDTSFIINKAGEIVGKYRKAHLYPDEHRYFKAGNNIDVFEVDGVKVGLATCYDHGVEEHFRILALKGAEIIFIPSAVPKGFEYLLELRTRARAQDNQIFTIAANRAGTDVDVEWCGNSMIINPKGEIIERADDKETTIAAEVDLQLIHEERKQEPIFRSRRPELYHILAEDQEVYK